jgi:hypothetical protein
LKEYLLFLWENPSRPRRKIRRAFLPHPPARRKPECRRFEKTVGAKQIHSSRKIALLCPVRIGLSVPRTSAKQKHHALRGGA